MFETRRVDPDLLPLAALARFAAVAAAAAAARADPAPIPWDARARDASLEVVVDDEADEGVAGDVGPAGECVVGSGAEDEEGGGEPGVRDAVVVGAAGEDRCRAFLLLLCGRRGRGGIWARGGEDGVGEGEDDAASGAVVGEEERREVFGLDGG